MSLVGPQGSHTTWTGYAAAGTSVALGDVVCLNAAGTRYVKATTANLALQSLGSVGVALGAADGDTPGAEGFELQFCGLVPAEVFSDLGAGADGPIYVSTTGRLTRASTGASVGTCDEDGNVLVNFASGGVSAIELPFNVETHSLNGGPSLTFTAATKTITRGSGSWITDGFTAGETIFLYDLDSLLNATNSGLKTVVTVTALDLTVAETLVDQTPVANTVRIVGGEYVSYGDPAGTLPKFGMIRVEKPATDGSEPDRTVVSSQDANDVTYSLLSLGRFGTRAAIGATWEQSDASEGVTARYDRLGFWGDQVETFADQVKWEDDRVASRVFQHKTSAKLINNSASPTSLGLTATSSRFNGINGSSAIFVKATRSTDDAWWIYSNGRKVYTEKEAGAASWDFDGTNVTGDGGGNIQWDGAAFEPILPYYFYWDGTDFRIYHPNGTNYTTIPALTQTLSGGVAGATTPEAHGAVGDGSTNDSTAFQAALDAIEAGTYGALLLGAKTYRLTSGLTFNAAAKVAVIGVGPKSVLKIEADAAALLFRNATQITCSNFNIEGNSTGSNQNGIEIGYLGGDGTSKVQISNITCLTLGGRGFSWAYMPDLDGPEFVNCKAVSCLYGFYGSDIGTLSSCSARLCTTGARLNGNVNFVSSDFTSCTTAVHLVAGGNDGHGTFAGCQFRHNTTALKVGAIANGHFFANCLFYEGDLLFDGSNAGAVHFVGGVMDMTTYTLAGRAHFTGVRFDAGYFTSATLTGGENVFVECFDIDGSIPSWIGDVQRKSYTFPSDANQTLSAQDSVAREFIVANGTITTSRTLTSTLTPTKGREILFYNQNVYAVDFKWSTGTAVTIQPGQRAYVGADGTNAVLKFDVLNHTVGPLTVKSFPGLLVIASTTPTNITGASYTMADDTCVSFSYEFVCARRTAVTKAGTYRGRVTYRRTGGAGPTIVGAAVYETDQETTAGDGIAFVVSSNTISAQWTSADTDSRNIGGEFRIVEVTDA